ncbi:relaxase/mobilization nuclease domain-containing protein [Pedobacter sp. GR22-6]|uniref:relaxase/mobilization nuclease domain-containing protein n=1 Tax=Pedobacter sp. GR22-6 TaxID=3127957 RepID=UPI00307E1F12
MEQGRATFLMAENYLKDSGSLNALDKWFVLKHRAELNERVKTNCVHISLNFETNEQISSNKMQEIARDYMERIGFAAQPYLVYRHKDAAHPHLHIVSTNIKADGSRISLHNLGRDASEKARQAIELKYGLVKAEGRGRDEELMASPLSDLKKIEYGRDETKKSITQIVNAVVQKYNYSTLAELNAILGRFNIYADRGHERSGMFSKNGLLYRVIDQEGNKLGVPLKASKIAGRHTLLSLEKRFAKNKVRRKILASSLKQRIDEVLKSTSSLNEFESRLSDQKIEILYRKGKGGQVYGLTYIDHASRSIFNGSELGKIYSAKALLDHFSVKESIGYLPGIQSNIGELSSSHLTRGEEKSIDYLQPPSATNYLDLLFGKVDDNQPPVPGRRKRRKKRRQQEHQINL